MNRGNQTNLKVTGGPADRSDVATSKDEKMPWAVRIALGWFVLLAIASCAPLVYVQTMWKEGWGWEWMLWQHVTCIGFVALGAGFVAAILHGRREWVATPYFLIGGFAFFAPITGSRASAFTAGMWIYLVSVAVATTVPLALLYLPRSSRRWFWAFPLRRGLGCGCCTLLVLAIVGALSPMFDGTRSSQKTISAQLHATAGQGWNAFRLLAQNETSRAAGGQCVDMATCTNSVEFAEKLAACQGRDAEELLVTGGRWSFAVNVPPDVPDTFPVMITANVDPAQLPREWDGETDKDRRLELRPLEGVEPFRFGNRGIVVVRKSGAAQIIKRRHMTFGIIFGNRPFKLGDGACYLTPVGRRNLSQAPMPADGEGISNKGSRCLK